MTQATQTRPRRKRATTTHMEIEATPVRMESRLGPILMQVAAIFVVMRFMSVFNVLTSVVQLGLAGFRFAVAAVTAALAVIVSLVPIVLIAGLATRLIQLVNDYRRDIM